MQLRDLSVKARSHFPIGKEVLHLLALRIQNRLESKEMRQGVTLNEKVTAIMAAAGVGMQYYTVLCPVCGKETTLMVGKGENLDERVELHLLELQDYHDPNAWVNCPDESETEADGGEEKKSTSD